VRNENDNCLRIPFRQEDLNHHGVKEKHQPLRQKLVLFMALNGTVKYYAQIHLQVWQNSVCTGQGRLAIWKCIKSERVMNGGSV